VNEQQNEYGRWVPAEPLPGTFGLRWQKMIRHRRELGQNCLRAFIGGWRDVRTVDHEAKVTPDDRIPLLPPTALNCGHNSLGPRSVFRERDGVPVPGPPDRGPWWWRLRVRIADLFLLAGLQVEPDDRMVVVDVTDGKVEYVDARRRA
jgi:hypothetical protein